MLDRNAALDVAECPWERRKINMVNISILTWSKFALLALLNPHFWSVMLSTMLITECYR